MNRLRWLDLVLAASGAATVAAAQAVPGPAFRDVIGLRSVGSATISPDGKAIAYTIRSTDWSENRFDTEVWLWREGLGAIQLTRTPKGSSTTPRWSPDGKWLGFLADRGERQQLFVIGASGGEALQLTRLKDGVSDYRFAPSGGTIALAVVEPEPEAMTKRKALYGEFAVEDQDYRQRHLWLLDFDPARWTPDTSQAARPTRLTEGADFAVGAFAWSPDGSRIAFDHRRDPLINSGNSADISILEVATRRVAAVVARPGADQGPVWSPDGGWLLFTTLAGDTVSNFYRNNQVMKIAATGGVPVRLAAQFDEQIGNLIWTREAIWFGALQKTKRQIFQLNAESGAVIGPMPGFNMVSGLDVSPDGRWAAITAQPDAASLPEIFRGEIGGMGAPTKVTDLTAQLAGWNLGPSDVVSWRSRDGAQIEGVLHRPRDFDPAKRYPLLVVIHGGPTGIDFPQPVPFYVYPIPEWVAKGAVVLRPNYRGSAGYGEKFRSLNVRNLGVGDMWDVMSGVDHLIRQGIVDSTRMGAMGWSQGGYISAFLTTNTPRFKAISVGAGISNWVTYYVSTDIHPFTRQYLQSTPWNDPSIYARTSPMTTIRQAKTPTLIQHGEFDRRVPIQNAYELFQGLQDQGVPTRLVIYKGFGHGIDKPKEQLAAVWHNWQWFAKYLWGEEVTIPLDEPKAVSDKAPGR
jgi:dipeptidyl aminopeptidase/acylaminoacyl peptidase